MNSKFDSLIDQFLEQADKSYQEQNYKQALRQYYSAWLTLSKSLKDSTLASRILLAIANTYYRLEKFETAIEALRSALDCHKADNHAEIYLRLGQCLWNCGHKTQGRTYLQKAYRTKSELFKNEPKLYREVIDDLIF